MKGLSLTLTIVIIAIVLLVTALVIMTIFGTQMGNIMGVLGIWSTDTMKVNLCQQKCATYCQLNPGSPGADWSQFSVKVDNTDNTNAISNKCSEIMKDYPPCTCSLVKK
ncbi:MAG: hypothetical protein J7K54_02605 [Candidatus Aenigmarchaeota archaeon]|nr:hypothetical protein [Candidatus Aenigmarchaeota archaeon]